MQFGNLKNNLGIKVWNIIEGKENKPIGDANRKWPMMTSVSKFCNH